MAGFAPKRFRKFAIRTQISSKGKLGLRNSRKLVDASKGKMSGSPPTSVNTGKVAMAKKVVQGQRKVHGAPQTV